MTMDLPRRKVRLMGSRTARSRLDQRSYSLPPLLPTGSQKRRHRVVRPDTRLVRRSTERLALQVGEVLSTVPRSPPGRPSRADPPGNATGGRPETQRPRLRRLPASLLDLAILDAGGGEPGTSDFQGSGAAPSYVKPDGSVCPPSRSRVAPRSNMVAFSFRGNVVLCHSLLVVANTLRAFAPSIPSSAVCLSVNLLKWYYPVLSKTQKVLVAELAAPRSILVIASAQRSP